MNVWTQDYEKTIIEWKAKCFVNMWLQLQSAYHYERVNSAITYPIMIISTLSGATFIVLDNFYIKHLMAFFSLLSVILTGLFLQIHPDRKSQGHFRCMRLYSSLIREIDYSMNLPSKLRPKPIYYLYKINKIIDIISEKDIIIPRFVIFMFEKKFGNLDKILYGTEIIDILRQDIKQKQMFFKFLDNNFP